MAPAEVNQIPEDLNLLHQWDGDNAAVEGLLLGLLFYSFLPTILVASSFRSSKYCDPADPAHLLPSAASPFSVHKRRPLLSKTTDFDFIWTKSIICVNRMFAKSYQHYRGHRWLDTLSASFVFTPLSTVEQTQLWSPTERPFFTVSELMFPVIDRLHLLVLTDQCTLPVHNFIRT